MNLGLITPGSRTVGPSVIGLGGGSIAKKSEETAIGEVVERLTLKHPRVPPLTVADVVQKLHAKFGGRPVRDFVPLFPCSTPINGRDNIGALLASPGLWLAAYFEHRANF